MAEEGTMAAPTLNPVIDEIQWADSATTTQTSDVQDESEATEPRRSIWKLVSRR